MIWIIIFLGIIAVSEAWSLYINIKNNALQKSVEMLTKQLQDERAVFLQARERFDKNLATIQDARDLWAKKYYELEIQLKKLNDENI